ncbi:hypothetical protein [Nocardia sp. NPDC058497]|uniref:hypothetical protein n=1 Tax=Nocardia sp. NPDC058497 TaxID=3346529 RepID=UPI00364EA4CB
MAEPILTEDQARQSLARWFGPDRDFMMMETRHGWVGRAILTDRELEQGLGLGLGNYVLNKQTGVITAHRSLPPKMIGEEFDQAIETGRPIQGGQVYPPLHRISLLQISEDPNTVQYEMQVTALEQTENPSTTQQLTITKNPYSFHPTDSLAASAASWAEARSRATGTWPTEGSFEQ